MMTHPMYFCASAMQYDGCLKLSVWELGSEIRTDILLVILFYNLEEKILMLKMKNLYEKVTFKRREQKILHERC